MYMKYNDAGTYLIAVSCSFRTCQD